MISYKKECPTCGIERFAISKSRKPVFMCPICDEYEMKVAARDALRKNKRAIELGLIKSGKVDR